MVNQTQKKTASSISDKSGVTHLQNSVTSDEQLPTLVDKAEAVLLLTNKSIDETVTSRTCSEGLRLTAIIGLTSLTSAEIQEVLDRVEDKVTPAFHKFTCRFAHPKNGPAQNIRALFSGQDYKAWLGDKSDEYGERINYLKYLKDPSDKTGKRNLCGIGALKKYSDPPSRKLILKRLAKAVKEYNELSADDKETVDNMTAEKTVNASGLTKETAADFAAKSSGLWAIVSPKSAAK